MKVCVTAQGPDISSPVDPRFGRARFFIFVDTETMNFEAVENPAAFSGGGAGVRAARLIAEKKAEVVITGRVGPNAQQALEAAGVKVVAGAAGLSVKETIRRFLEGRL